MTQWRLVNGNQSVPIEKFLEMVGNTATNNSTAPSPNLQSSNVANSPILIASSPSNVKITNQNVQINQQLLNVSQNKPQNTINGMPIIASIAPNTPIPQAQNVVIIVSFLKILPINKRKLMIIFVVETIYLELCYYREKTLTRHS